MLCKRPRQRVYTVIECVEDMAIYEKYILQNDTLVKDKHRVVDGVVSPCWDNQRNINRHCTAVCGLHSTIITALILTLLGNFYWHGGVGTLS